MADWANLPEGLLDLIAERIHQIKDLTVIDSVCKSWKSALTFDSPKFPLLVLAEEPPSVEEDVITRPRCFFNLFTSKIYKIDLPEAYARKCLGISFGWMLTFGMDLNINLLHPFLRQQICLSPESTFIHQYDKADFTNPLQALLTKAVLSCSPSQESCIIMVIYGRDSYLAFARVRSNDKPWIEVHSPSAGYQDLIYYKEQFYAVNCHGRVVVCNINNDNDSIATFIAPPPIELLGRNNTYLVESSGDLLLISRVYGGWLFDFDYYTDDDADDDDENNNDAKVNYYTLNFLIYKMVEAEDGTRDHEYRYKWVEVNDLGNKALFLGNNSSVSFSVSLKEDLKANCIYFTDDNEFLGDEEGQPGPPGHDMGIFNMEDGTIERHYTGRSYSEISPPFWYI